MKCVATMLRKQNDKTQEWKKVHEVLSFQYSPKQKIKGQKWQSSEMSFQLDDGNEYRIVFENECDD